MSDKSPTRDLGFTYIYPDLDPKTRALRVRLSFDNPGGVLKPNMYADVVLGTTTQGAYPVLVTRAILSPVPLALLWCRTPLHSSSTCRPAPGRRSIGVCCGGARPTHPLCEIESTS